MSREARISVLPGQVEYCLPGHNALETSIILGQSWTRKGKPYMLVETVKRVLETLERNQVPYAVIGGLAVSHHAVPRLTQDVDLVILAEHAGRAVIESLLISKSLVMSVSSSTARAWISCRPSCATSAKWCTMPLKGRSRIPPPASPRSAI